MNSRVKTIAGASAVVLLLGGGAIAAVTATGRSTTPSARAQRLQAHAARRAHGRDMKAASAYLGIAAGQIEAQLAAGKSLAQIAQETRGRSAAGLVAAVLAARRAQLARVVAGLSQRVQAEVERPGGPRAPRHASGNTRHDPVGSLFTVRSFIGVPAAAYLGVSAPVLRRELETGRSLADVARAEERSQDGLIAVLIAARTRTLASQLQAGALSRPREQALLAHLPRRVRALVQRSFPAPAAG